MGYHLGDRVGAISHGADGKVYIFGYGTYQGRETPVDAGGWIGQVLVENEVPNPKIVLDSGKVVWGCECWWASEATVLKQVMGREIIILDIDEERKRVGTERN